MQRFFHKLDMVLLHILVLLASQVHKSTEDEITDNTLPVVFSDTTQASWKSTDKAAKFEMQVSSLMNGHCPSNLDECCLKFWNKTRQFKSSDVKIVGYTTKDSNLEVKFYASLPNGSDIRKDSKTVVPSTTLEEILWYKRHALAAGVRLTVHSVGKSVDTELDSEPTKLMNFTMIPISFAALIIVSMLACCFHVCHKRKMKSLEIQRRKQLTMKNKSKKLDFTASSPYAAPKQRVDENRHPERRVHQRSYDGRDGDTPDHRHGEQEIDCYYQKQPRKKKHRKKKKMDRDYEEYQDEGNGTLEIGQQNHSFYERESVNRDTTEDNEGQVPEREGRKRRTKKKRRRHDYDHEQAVDDEGFDEANGTVGQHDEQFEHAHIFTAQLPPVRPSRHIRHNSSEA